MSMIGSGVVSGLAALGVAPAQQASEQLAQAHYGAFIFEDAAILGTRMALHVNAADQALALAAAHAARAEIDRLAGVLDTRRSDSEISRLNASSEHIASPDLFAVIARAEHWRRASDGYFSARLGRALALWSAGAPPARALAARLARAADTADVRLEADTRRIHRPDAVVFAVDALAKGYIVDAALNVLAASKGVSGAMIDIGGDIRTAGAGPDSGWQIGVPDPRLPFDNAPLIDVVAVDDAAIATSGRGPRDAQIKGRRYSATLSPKTGWPVAANISVTAIAKTAADADALATALMTMPSAKAASFIERLAGAAARVTPEKGEPRLLGGWAALQAGPPELVRVQTQGGAQNLWHKDWQALATFTAPRRQLIRDPDFRSPYLAMWLTDTNNKPVRTLILIGKNAEWQRDNFIWWNQNRARARQFISTRSMSTSGAGVYNVFWDGVDDAGQPVPPGKYVLHVETSRERGLHTHRSLALDFTRAERFRQELPTSEESGGLVVSFDHY